MLRDGLRLDLSEHPCPAIQANGIAGRAPHQSYLERERPA